MKKGDAQAIFDRLDEAGLTVSLHAQTARTEVTGYADSEPFYAKGEVKHFVRIEMTSIDDPAVLHLIASQAEHYEAKVRGEIGAIELR